MTLNFHQLALLVLLTTAIHWLVARAAITKWFWDLRWWPEARSVHLSEGTPVHAVSRVDGPLAPQLHNFIGDLLACAACSGFWLGLGLGVVGLRPLELGPSWLDVAGSALAGVVGTPILEGVLLWGLNRTAIQP